MSVLAAQVRNCRTSMVLKARDFKWSDMMCNWLILSDAYEVRSLHNRRYAAAFDRHAIDLSLEQILSTKAQIYELLHIQFLDKRAWPFSRRSSKYQSSISRTYRERILTRVSHSPRSITGANEATCSSFFDGFGTVLKLTRTAHNIVITEFDAITDPLESAICIKRALYRKRLAAFLIYDLELTDQLGLTLATDLRREFLKWTIKQSPVFSDLTRYLAENLEKFLDLPDVTHAHLEDLWNECVNLRPDTLRDVLLHLQARNEDPRGDSRQKERSGYLCSNNVAGCTQTWPTVLTILGERLQFPDIWYLCGSAKEFLTVINFVTLESERYWMILPVGPTGSCPLFVCMRLLGLFVTYWDDVDTREGICGLMAESIDTLEFLRIVASARICALRSDFSDGTHISQDSTLDQWELRDRPRKTDKLLVNLNIPKVSRPISWLSRRSRSTFSDGCQVRISPYAQNDNREDWKLHILEALAVASIGTPDICKAMEQAEKRNHSTLRRSQGYTKPTFVGSLDESLLQMLGTTRKCSVFVGAQRRTTVTSTASTVLGFIFPGPPPNVYTTISRRHQNMP